MLSHAPRRLLWLAVLAMPLATASAEVEVFASAPSTLQMVGATESSPALVELLADVNVWDIVLDPDSGILYFSDPTAGLIGSVDPNAVTPTVTPVISRPGAVFHGLALDGANGRLFFQDSADDTLRVLHLNGNTEEVLLQGGDIVRPNDIAYDAQRDWLYFTDSGSDKLLVIQDLVPPVDPGAVVSLGGHTGIWGVTVHPQDGSVYLSYHDSGQIHQFQPDSLNLSFAENGWTGARGLHFDNLGRLFCNVSGLNAVHRVCAWLGPAGPALSFTPAANGRGLIAYDPADRDSDLLADEWEKQFGESVHDLDEDSDPDNDGRSALVEMVFNGSPLDGNDPQPSVQPSGGDGFVLGFDGLSEGYQFNGRFSSNLADWLDVPAESLVAIPIVDTPYSRWSVEIIGLEGLGLDPGSVFVSFDPEASAP